MALHIGILLALTCAFASNLAFFYKHRGACAAAPVCMSHPLRSARSLLTSTWFAVGMGVAVVAWVLHVAALAMAPMSVVQAVLAGGVVLVAVIAERMFGFEVGRRQWLGLGLTALGLVLLGLTLPAIQDAHATTSRGAMISFEAALLGLGGLLVLGPRVGAPAEHHGVMLGAAAGILFGASDVAIKALTGFVGDDGATGLVSPWLVLTVMASIGAFYVSARALQEGDAVPVIAITGTVANVAGIAGGIIVFGDPLPGDVFGIIIQAFAFVLVIVASALTPAPVRSAGLATASA